MPASAPVFVVAISSPDPTMEPAIIKPGPIRRKIPITVLGGARGVAASSFVFVIAGSIQRGMERGPEFWLLNLDQGLP